MFGFAKALFGSALVVSGLVLIVFGNAWAPAAFDLLPDSEMGLWLELFVPFLPMALIGIGAVIYVRCGTA
jgi:hypothetical protein